MSSTVSELAAERRAASEAIEAMHLHPVLFELGARPHAPRDVYSAYLSQSHIFVAIYWQSYGWVAPEMEISGIEDEYLLADGHPKLVYVKDPAPERDPQLASLLRRIGSESLSYKKFSSSEELRQLIQNDLALLLTERFEETLVDHDDDDNLQSHLLALVNEFVGRSAEMAELKRVILDEKRRLVSLVGPGGVGKSRLSLEFATAFKDHFRDGAHIVLLEPLSGPKLVVSTILHTLEIQESFGGDPLDILVRALCERELLLVLDNFEHVLPAAAAVGRLVEECPNVRVLVTTRHPLQLRGEIEVPISPLPIPKDDTEAGNGLVDASAVQLFVARAKEVNRLFELSNDNVDAVVQICRELDGLPLAIELAAARTRLLPPTAIAQRLWDRFNLLKGGPLDFPDRHQTLKATIDWSFDLLSPEDRAFFRQCSVFWGGWTLDAAEHLFDLDGSLDVIDRLQSLLENSLVRRFDEGGESRFVMLESVRRYAWDQLVAAGENEEISERYACYYLDLIDQAYTGLRNPGQIEWLDKLDEDIENFRGALRWCLAHDGSDRLVDAAWSIWPFWWTRDHLNEGRWWIDEVMEHEDELSRRATGRALAIKGALTFWQGDFNESVALLARATEELRAAGDDHMLALARLVVAVTHAGKGDTIGALEILQESRGVLRRVGDTWGLGVALNATCLVGNAVDTDDVTDEMFEEAVSITSSIGSRVELNIARANLGRRLALRGKIDKGKHLIRDAIGSLAEARTKRQTAYCIELLAEVAIMEEDYARAARLYGAAGTIRERIGNPPEFLLAGKRDRLLTRLEEILGHDSSKKEYDIGAAMTFHQAVDLALAPLGHGEEPVGASLLGSGSHL